MPLTIKVYSDYVCPFCLLADGQLRAAAAERDVIIEHLPFELRPYPTPTLRPEDGYMQTSWREKVSPIAEQLGVPIHMPTISPQPYTHLAFEGYQFAKQAGIGETYHSRMYKAFFQDGLDIGDISVLTELAEELGLDGRAYQEALEAGTYREAHKGALHHALYEAHITAAPTYVIGKTSIKWLLYKEQFLEAIDAELKQQRLEQWSTGMSCTIDGCS
ncbi:DsbA family oxidoreductase [Paenibacillus paeoniae]|uniref:2-hydroxychromene-2-carboxylate isomerase n=1 Tax=Paenibacillus paeoniae TaxID=2292705 RepID=A0A371PIA8_9BACL|nr:DsbA family protein [Paenibacillus paeoniae]REK75258.1 2-hydroxychromene-2-carboxylate isomerase [Paenibacillus paeoniae]